MTAATEAAVKLGVLGAAGRMGRAVVQAATEAGHPIVAAVDHGDALGRDVGQWAGLDPIGVPIVEDLEALAAADVVVDFSLPGVAKKLFERAAGWKTAVVTGTTGFDSTEAHDRLAEKVALVAAANFSQGVTLLVHLCAMVTDKMGPSFDPEIVELHHRRKVDAPSGTALAMAEAVRSVREARPLHGRSGVVGARTDDEIGVLAVRGGDVVGEHTLYLLGEGERLELTHRATDRMIFARGAVRAAAWVLGRPPGNYGMVDVMGLNL